ncbi:MAG: hypothetical protein V3U15_02535 [Nitrospinota bacterium]
MLKDIALLLIGAVIGLASTLFVEHKKRVKEKYERREQGKTLLTSIIEEVKMGVERCEGLARRLENDPPEISFSRIYTGLWDSMAVDLAKCLDDPKIIRLLNSIYYCFDLVNFNMNRNEFGVGAAFAKDKLATIKEHLRDLQSKEALIPDTLLLDTPTLDHAVKRLQKLTKTVLERWYRR